MKSYSHFFSKNINIHAIFHGQRFNSMLTNDIVSFEQLGPDEMIILTFTTLWANSAYDKVLRFFMFCCFFFSEKQALTFHANCLLRGKPVFWEKVRKIF